ncbi:MAG TPA: hypothetical protein VL326_22900 [Kofleriaceae bacterium]|nr:hypothetical protein [Kofleriaceae bacterium]
MGAGGSQEAEYALKESVPAGTYHFVLDSIIIKPVDVTFDLFVRRGTTDTMLATWMQHFDPIPASFDAQAYELDRTAPAIDFMAGDQLIFRYSGANTTSSEAYIPNGDGSLSKGRIPHFTLPK